MPAERQGGGGHRVALALGSGGARGLAHIGVIEELERRGFELAALAGSSMGALVGGIRAAGRLAEYRAWVCALERGDVLRLLDFAFGHPGLIKGDRVIAALREMVGEHRIEDLPVAFTAVATDLAQQREVWLNRGPLWDAIRASIAIPMLFTPHRVRDRDLVDGGLLAPVPVAPMRAYHADLVIAVDVNARTPALRSTEASASEPEPGTSDAPAPDGLRAKLAALFEGILEKKEEATGAPGLLDLMSRSLDTMQAQLARLQLAMNPPDLLVRVPRETCMFHEFWRAREAIEAGRTAARRALDAEGW